MGARNRVPGIRTIISDHGDQGQGDLGMLTLRADHVSQGVGQGDRPAALLGGGDEAKPEVLPHVVLTAYILEVQGGPLGPLPGPADPEQDLVASDTRMPGLGPAQT